MFWATLRQPHGFRDSVHSVYPTPSPRHIKQTPPLPCFNPRLQIPYDDAADDAISAGTAPLFAGKGGGSDALSALDEADDEAATTLGGGGGGGGEPGALAGKRLPGLRKYGTALIGYLFAQVLLTSMINLRP